ncbi:pre-mRNA-processing factor 39-like [Lineus longissimus]|uniref:pre-mRNA-processing factor 39-like n=1 Tax=Lineus longissimus TaxID=88925 RepID=UPI00315DEC43
MADAVHIETVGEENQGPTDGVSSDGVNEPMEVSTEATVQDLPVADSVNMEQPTVTEIVTKQKSPEYIELSSLGAGDTETIAIHEQQETVPVNVEPVEEKMQDIKPMQESDDKSADGPDSPGNPPLPLEPSEPESGDNVDTPASPGFTPLSPGPEQNMNRAEMTGSDNDDSNLSNVIVKDEVEELATPASPTEEESVGVADRVVAHIEQEIAKKRDAESSHGSQSGAATPEDEHAEKRPRSPEHREKKKKRRKERVEEDERTVELEKYWKAVKNNPADFTGWTYLLQYVEQENKMTWAREAFDAFFKQYPYCYGYWKKYADMEKRQGNSNMEVAAEVYERGLRAIPLSVDLWIHYIHFALSVWEDDEKRIRDLYDRALSASGMDFRSDKLWEQYINWEKDYDLKKVTAIYDRAFTIPTLLYSQHFDNFKIFVKKHHPKDILDLDEFLKLRQEVVEASALTSDKVDELEGPPGGDPDDDAPPGMEPQAKKTPNDDEETLALREKIINGREAIYLENEVEVGKRWALEEGIRRPYFHVKPLERAQLKNWREYLDFEMENGTHERVVVLFERCMIACALYEDFWMKYARYLEKHSIDGVRNVFRRACTIHLPKKPNIHLAWAAFEERNGNTEEAWEILQGIESNLPGLVMLSIRRIGFERRQGNHSEAEHLFQEYIQNAKSTSISTFFATKYARYAFRVMKDKEKAQRILMQAIEKDKMNIKLYLQLLDFEYQSPDPGDEEILRIFDMVLLNDDFPLEQKIAFSRRRVEYLEEFGCKVGSLVEVNEEHQKMVKDHKVEEKKTTKGGERDLNQVNTQQHHTGRKRGADDDVSSSRKRGRGGAHDGSANGGDSQQYNYGNWEGYNAGTGSNQNYNYQQGYQQYQQYQQYQN